jgi:hypothetical protein
MDTLPCAWLNDVPMRGPPEVPMNATAPAVSVSPPPLPIVMLPVEFRSVCAADPGNALPANRKLVLPASPPMLIEPFATEPLPASKICPARIAPPLTGKAPPTDSVPFTVAVAAVPTNMPTLMESVVPALPVPVEIKVPFAEEPSVSALPDSVPTA